MLATRNLIIAVAVLFIIGAGAYVFAHDGMRWGGHHGMYGGYHHMYDSSNFNKEEYKQMEESRKSFFKETKEIRANLLEKERELQSVLSKSEPDRKKASNLQKEISKLYSQLDQKRIDHMIELKKSNPNMDSRFMHKGPMMGYGSYGPGYC